MGILGLFIHSVFGDGSGPAGRMTDQRILFYSIVAHLVHLEFEWTLQCLSRHLYIPSVRHLSICHLIHFTICPFRFMLIYDNLCIFMIIIC